MATIGDLILRTEEILYGMGVWERPDWDQLNGGINASVTAMIGDTDIWRRGDYAEFTPLDGTVGEIVLVQAYVSGTNTSTIERAHRGTTAATQADNILMRRNPDFPRVTIDQKIQHLLDTPGLVWPHVWSWTTGTLTFTTGDHLYDLGTYVDDVVSVYQSNINTDGQFAPIHSGLWEVIRQVDTNVSANGTLLRLAGVWDENTAVYYTAKLRPAYADLANIDAGLANLIPRAVAGLLLQERAPQIDNSQRKSGRAGGRDLFAYGSELYRGFERDLDQYRRQLLLEHPPLPKFKARMRSRW